jgi:methyl-accepting chemotaxis protein
MLRKADPRQHNRNICRSIKSTVKNIEHGLPQLTMEEMDELKKNLTEFDKIKGETLPIKFLNIRNAFLVISKVERRADYQELIKPILQYLTQYNYIFDLILKSREMEKDTMLKDALWLLYEEITAFVQTYKRVITDIDANTLTYQNYEPLDDLAEEIVESTEELMEEAQEEYYDEEEGIRQEEG